MSELLSVSDAANELDLNPSRVRALAASGDLEAERVGGRWLIEKSQVLLRQREGQVGAGRPFAPHNAWGLIFLASDQDAPWLNPGARWRLNRAIAYEELEELAPRLRKRASISHFHALQSEIPRLLDDARAVRAGISAAGAHGLALVSGEEADVYLKRRDLAPIVREHALHPAPVGEANVVLRVVPSSVWFLDSPDRIAPPAAVALDLAGDPDSRSRRIGRQALVKLGKAASQRAKS